MIELYQHPEFKNSVYFLDTTRNKISTQTGYGVRKLVQGLRNNHYAWFKFGLGVTGPKGFEKISEGKSVDEILNRDFPEAQI